jgi:glycerol uptake facilitator-like aquaporin
MLLIKYKLIFVLQGIMGPACNLARDDGCNAASGFIALSTSTS